MISTRALARDRLPSLLKRGTRMAANPKLTIEIVSDVV
jgi:hypothetical protein